MKPASLMLTLVLILISSSVTSATDGDKDRIPPLAQLSDKQAPKSRANNAEQAEKQLAAESRILKFVGEHQPDLLELLEFIKTKQPNQYQLALREMGRTQQRLEGLAQRDQELHAVELELWNIRSKLRLVAAQIPVVGEKKRQTLEAELKQLVAQEIEQNLARLRIQRSRMEAQLEKLNQQIEHAENAPDQVIAAALKNWQNRIAKQMPRKKKRNAPSAPAKASK